jgi:hypothetical protein
MFLDWGRSHCAIKEAAVMRHQEVPSGAVNERIKFRFPAFKKTARDQNAAHEGREPA